MGSDKHRDGLAGLAAAFDAELGNRARLIRAGLILAGQSLAVPARLTFSAGDEAGRFFHGQESPQSRRFGQVKPPSQRAWMGLTDIVPDEVTTHENEVVESSVFTLM